MKLKCLIIILAILLQTNLVWAITYYFDATNGSDGNTGTSSGAAWQTLDKLNTVMTNGTVVCGDTVSFDKGETFTANDSSDNLAISNFACTSSTKLIITTHGSGARPIIDMTALGGTASGSTCTSQGVCITYSAWIEIHGLEFRKPYTNFIYGSQDIVLDDLYLNGSCKENLRIKRASTSNVSARITVKNSEIANSTANYSAAGCTGGELSYNGTDTAQNGGTEDTTNTVTFQNNKFHNGGEIELKPGTNKYTFERNEFYSVSCSLYESALLVQKSITPVTYDHVIRYNYIHDNTCGGLGLNGGATVYGNVIDTNSSLNQDGTQKGGIYFDSNTDSQPRLIYNNTIYGNAGPAIRFRSTVPSGYVQRNNIFWGNGAEVQAAKDEADDASDPLMVSPAAGNFALQSTSPAINAGTSCDLAYNGSACDRGAHETMALSSMEAVDANTINVDFQANVNQPLIPASSVTGFSCRADTVALTITGVSRVGNARMAITVSDTMLNTHKLDCSYSAGNVTDSALIGNLKNQSLFSFTNQTVTNSIAGGGTATVTQSRFRFYQLYGPTQASWKPIAGENISVTVPPGSKFILVAKIRGEVADPVSFNPRLRYYVGSGSYTEIPATFSTDNIKMLGIGSQPSHVLAEGTATTQDTLTSDETTNVACSFVRSATSIPNIDLSQDSETECAWAIELDSDASGYFDFRIYKDSGDALSAYTVTPRVTVGSYAAMR